MAGIKRFTLAVAVLSAALLWPTAAQAAGHPDLPPDAGPTCEVGKVCFWTKTVFQGDKHVVTPKDECQAVPGDGAQSAMNVTERAITLYGGADCKGTGTALNKLSAAPVIQGPAKSFRYAAS